jgi:Tfp pilus assembly protein PilF
VSLIADSLKKAVKEKTAPNKWEADPEVNPVAKREPVKRPGLSSVFWVLLLIVLPTGALVYLISIGAFSLQDTPVSQKSELPVSAPAQEARVSPPRKPAPEVTLEKPVVSPPQKPVKKIPVEKKSPRKKTSAKPIKKEKTVVKKIIPPVSSQKKIEKPKVATVVPVTPPAVAPKKETSAVLPKETPALKQPEVEIPDHEIAHQLEPAVKPSVDQTSEKTKVSPGQKSSLKTETPAKLPVVAPLEEIKALPEQEPVAEAEETKTVAVVPAPKTENPVSTVQSDLEKKAAESKETPAPEPVDEEIPGENVAEKITTQAPSLKETVLKKEQPPAPNTVVEKENLEKPVVEVQKKSPEVASIPSSQPRPEISRIDPKGQKNVFNNSDYYFNRGIFFQQAGDWQKALTNYSKAEALDPNNPDTYNNKGVVLKEMGEYDQALDEFLRAVFLDAGYAKAYNNIGVVYYMQKNYPEAIRHYLKAIDINPTNLEAFNNLATIYKKQKESGKARGVLNRALSLDPDHPGTNYNLAVLYEESREIKPALYYYRRFIELGARNYPSLVIQVKEHLEGMKPQ